MQRHLLLLIFLICASASIAQINFFKRYGGEDYDYGYDIVEAADSGFWVAGTSGSFHIGHSDAFLMRLDKYGNRQWSIPYGGIENDGAYEMKYIPNYGIYLIGASNSWSDGDFDTYVAFVDESGNLLWEQTYPLGNWERGVEAALTADSGLVIGFNRIGDSTDNQDIGVMRIDRFGDVVWSTLMELPGFDEVTCLHPYQDSLMLMSSNRFDINSGDTIAHLTMLHEDGTLIWEDTLGSGPGTYTLNDFFLSNDTLYGVGGVRVHDTLIMNHISYRYKISQTNPYQIAEWMNNGIYESEGDVITPRVGSLRRYFAYHTTSIWTYENGVDFHVGRYSEFLTWEALVGDSWHPGFDILHEAIPTMDGGAALIGHHGGPGGAVIALVRIGANDTYPQINGVNFVDQLVGLTTLSETYGVEVYPNPAQDRVHVSANKIDITNVAIYSTSGQCVKKEAVMQQEVDMADLPTGMYLLELISGDQSIGTVRIAKH